MDTVPTTPRPLPQAPLLLLVRVNLLQGWRRFFSLRGQSPLLMGIVAAFVGGYLVLSFWLFLRALRFLGAFPGLGTVLTERLMYLLFALLFGMLLISNLVISYTNFFRNREATFLMSLPVPRVTVFRWKLLESMLLASWGFLFLITPLLLAFGLTRGVAWQFYVVTVFLVVLFIILPGVAGAWSAMLLGRYLDRRSFQLVLGALAFLAVAAFVLWWRSNPVDDVIDTRVLNMLDQLLIKTRFAQFPFLPSYWLSTSILQWAEGLLDGALFFLLVLLSHSSFFGFLALTRLGDVFYETASVVQSRPSDWARDFWGRAGANRVHGREWSPAFLERALGWLPFPGRDVRALVIKDALTFWRDTSQWGQSVVLFGLLAVYILNLRNFAYNLTNPFWVNLVSYLNLMACSLNLATVTTRFVFPQFSLEGKRLWIIGLAPMGLARAVRTKFWMATTASLIVTLSLVCLSSCLLKMTWDRILFFGAIATVMTFVLNGLAVGLGVLYPNFREMNPSRIVSGFGGTLCLVLSFVYILCSVILLGVGTGGTAHRPAWPLASVTTFAILSLGLGWLPLKLGFRHLKHLEI